jgi:hypothetical protein
MQCLARRTNVTCERRGAHENNYKDLKEEKKQAVVHSLYEVLGQTHQREL